MQGLNPASIRKVRFADCPNINQGEQGERRDTPVRSRCLAVTTALQVKNDTDVSKLQALLKDDLDKLEDISHDERFPVKGRAVSQLLSGIKSWQRSLCSYHLGDQGLGQPKWPKHQNRRSQAGLIVLIVSRSTRIVLPPMPMLQALVGILFVPLP